MSKTHALTAAVRASFLRGAGGGGKGGGGGHKPVEAPDSLRSIAYAQILDLVSEGEIEMWVHPSNPLQDCFLNETPIANPDGSLNFKNVQMDFRTGTQIQDFIPGFQGAANEIGIGVELRYGTPWTRTITDTDLNAVNVRLSVPALSKADTSNGDIGGYTIGYKIELATDGGAWVEKLNTAFTGKTSTKYERGHEIVLPTATTGWQLRVTRLTTQAMSAAIADTTNIVSYTEIIYGKFRYPMSAVVAVTVDAEQFNNIPSRAYRLRGRRIRVPSNYDASTRVYSGVWEGTFQTAYSNNPAWVFFDMATNSRYGLGHILTDAMVNKWALYEIAKYCDELVSDGKGGMEPRFTCNMYIQAQEDATRVMQTLATVFRGIMYAAGSSINAVADMPQDPIYTYTNANVIDGKFTYAGSSRKVRHTVGLVSWNDMTDFGRAKIAYYQDDAAIARYGIQPTEAIAMGCTSESQALRMAKYIITTEVFESDIVTFSVGLDGTVVAPGKIFNIADKLRAGARRGGRISAATISSVTLDAVPAALAPGDKITVTLPDATLNKRVVGSIVGKVVSVTVNFDDVPIAQSVWLVESVALNAQTFRALSVTESGDGISCGINALQHVAGKFDFVELDLVIDEPIITTGITTLVPQPTDLVLTWRDVADTNTTQQMLTLEWKPVIGAIGYFVKWRPQNGSWVDLGSTPGNTIDWISPTPGLVQVSVYAVNAGNFQSAPTFGGPYTVGPNVQPPLFVAGLEADIATALLTAENAAATADGAVVSFWQASPPTIGAGAGQASTGDIWFDTDDGNRIYRVVAGVWTDAQDDALATALAAASTAQATADGKVTTYFQTTAPGGTLSVGDLWYDSTAGVGKLYRWNGSSWSQNIADRTIDQLAGTGTNLLWDEYSRYLGPTLPPTFISGSMTKAFDATDRVVGDTSSGSLKLVTTGTGVGDNLWLGISASDYNVPVSANGKYIISARVKVGTANHKVGLRVKDSAGTSYTSPDFTIASASVWTTISFVADMSASSAKALVMALDPNRSGVTARTVNFDGLMIEAQIGTKATPSAWVPGAAGRNALVAIGNAAFAQATADGKIDSFYQTSPPTIGTSAGQARDGDIWFDTDDGNKIYTVVSGVWTATPDSRIALAITAAGTAQSTADGKSTLFYANAASPPTATGVGDLWFQLDTKLLKKWSGSAWVDNGSTLATGQVQNGVILPYSYGDELLGNPSFESNVSGTRKTTLAIYANGTDICDGWQLDTNVGASGVACGIDSYLASNGTYNLFIGVASSTSVPAGQQIGTFVKHVNLVPCQPKEIFVMSARIGWDASVAVPAGLYAVVRYGIYWLTAAGIFISEDFIDQTYGLRGDLRKTVVAPATAASAKIFCYTILGNGTGGAISTGNTPVQGRFDSVSLKRVSITGNNPNLLSNSDFTNGATGWSSGTVTKAGEESYQLRTGALSSGASQYMIQVIDLAPAAGEQFTYQCEAIMVAPTSGVSVAGAYIEFRNSSNVQISYSPIDSIGIADGYSSYRRLVSVGTVPAGTAKIAAITYFTGPISTVGIMRRPKLERGGVPTAYTSDVTSIVAGPELVVGTSNRRLGDARNMRQAQTAGVGAVASSGIITATSAGVINIAAFSMSYGGAVTISYSAVASAITGLTVGTTYVIYCLDDDYAGGTRTWLATTSMATAMNAGVGVVIAGSIKIPATGSSSPPSPSDPDCVMVNMVDPDGRLIAEIEPDQYGHCWNRDIENPGMVSKKLRGTKLGMERCSRLVAANLCYVEQSNSTPMELPDGKVRKSCMMFGQKMLTLVHGAYEWSVVADIVDLGIQQVVHADFDDNVLFAGPDKDHQVATHNIRYKP